MTDETFWKIVAASLTMIGAVVGALIAYSGVRAANILKSREIVKGAVEFLTGGTQKRTVGIALLSELLDSKAIHPKTAKIILEGQKAHLEDVDNKDAGRSIEQKNLETIKELLKGL